MATATQIKQALAKRALVNRLRASKRARMTATRRRSPVRGDGAKIEPIVHPLIDTEAITANSGTFIFFTRPVGQSAVAGFTKTKRDTNMELSGALPRPRVHITTGVRVVVSQITGDTTASPSININPDLTDFAATLRAINDETITILEIGTKEYLKVPTCQLPGNVGMDLIGEANAETATSNEAAWAWSLFSRGDYFSTAAARIKIPPLQSFNAKIVFPVTAKNAVISGGVKVSVILDGLLGREVM